jgi:hypothetical protein
METPEHLAKMSLHLNQNPELLDKIQGNGSGTPLISAVARSHEKCVKLLLEHKPNIEITTHDNSRDAFSCAVNAYQHYHANCSSIISTDNTQYNIIKMLLDSGNNNNVNSENIFLFTRLRRINFSIVIYKGITCLVKLFLSYITLDGSCVSYLNLALLSNNDGNKDPEIVRLLLESGAHFNFNDTGTGDTLAHACLSNGNIKAVKYIFLYHGSPIVHAPDSTLYDIPYSMLVFESEKYDSETKIKVLKLMHKFGANLWKNDLRYQFVSEEANSFYNETNKIRREPLSLKCLSRIRIMHTMGRNFVKKYKELEIPNELHEFLEFPDV